MSEVSDRIEKQIRLDAPVSRVWRAIADSEEFGAWFGVRLEGPWKVGEPIRGALLAPLTQATIDGALESLGLPSAPIADKFPEVFCVVDAIEPQSCFRFRWIPYGIDVGIDPATEPETTVEIRLAPDGDGTQLTLTESGFDQVSLDRRRRAFLMTDGGWSAQLENIARHVRADPET